ncbi:MAG: hypothetical protein U1F53_03490 [Burkholderiaceae bacterium]
MHAFWPASLALALAAPVGAFAADPTSSAFPAAASPAGLGALHQEIQALREAYETRLKALEQRLADAEARAPAPPAAPPAPPVAEAPAAPAPAPALAPAPATTTAAGNANAFNPALSLILSGGFTRTSRDPASYRIAGFQGPPDAEAGPGERGFHLGETELGLSASVDPWWRGAANIALAADDTVSVEEAYVQTTALGHGLSLKLGRFFSGVGYLNPQHAHTWDFVDNPLAYQALLGGQYNDDGLQLSWLAPTDQFIEVGLELGRGRGFPGGDNGHNGPGMAALTLHTGGDLGDSHSWRAGVSVLNARADGLGLVGTAADGSDLASAFTGRSRVWVADGVWKWAPDGNATRTSFKVQGEYLQSRRSGELTPEGADTAAYRSTASGWYLQGIYQFWPGWRLGLRTERLDAGSPDYGANAGLYALNGHSPRKNSLVLDVSASEFSRIRLQLAQDRARPGAADNELMLQYQMSLGAHGAHSY